MMGDLVNTVIVSIITSGVLAYIFKRVFERFLESLIEKRLKSYQHELDLKLETHKKQIEFINQKMLHNYSRLYDERA